jgi:tetratricopeptide (TPR) repeat protein
MFMKKRIFTTVSALLIGTFVFSQSLEESIKLTKNEQFETADAAFKKLITANPNNGDIYFYYGENFYYNDNLDMAYAMYQRGIEMNATNPLCYVGVGKILWGQGKEAEAKTNFYKAYAGLSGKKNITVLLKTAEVYIFSQSKDLIEANKLLAEAEKLDPKNPEVHILKGDAVLEANEMDASSAISHYEKAEALNKNAVLAILRQGKLYSRAKNYNLALDYYKKASAIDSTFAPAYREKAEIYFRAGQYANAVEQYKRYLELNNNCSARSRYAGFLNQAAKYKESVEQSKEALKCDPENAYTYRYKGRSEYETGDYANGLASMNTFFDLAAKNPKLKIISEDYEYRAKLYFKNNNDSLAIAEYNKALALQPEKQLEINRDLANLYMKTKRFAKAIETYSVNVASGKANVNDYFGLGRAYYYSKDYSNADSAFAKIIETVPQVNLGYLWRAKANVQQDLNNESWRAKPFYESYIATTKEADFEKNKKDLIEAYTYLGVYQIKQKQTCLARPYFEKIAALDAANENAKKFLESADAKKCE